MYLMGMLCFCGFWACGSSLMLEERSELSAASMDLESVLMKLFVRAV